MEVLAGGNPEGEPWREQASGARRPAAPASFCATPRRCSRLWSSRLPESIFFLTAAIATAPMPHPNAMKNAPIVPSSSGLLDPPPYRVPQHERRHEREWYYHEKANELRRSMCVSHIPVRRADRKSQPDLHLHRFRDHKRKGIQWPRPVGHSQNAIDHRCRWRPAANTDVRQVVFGFAVYDGKNRLTALSWGSHSVPLTRKSGSEGNCVAVPTPSMRMAFRGICSRSLMPVLGLCDIAVPPSHSDTRTYSWRSGLA